MRSKLIKLKTLRLFKEEFKVMDSRLQVEKKGKYWHCIYRWKNENSYTSYLENFSVPYWRRSVKLSRF